MHLKHLLNILSSAVSIKIVMYTLISISYKSCFNEMSLEQKDRSYNILKMHFKYINTIILLLFVFFLHSLNDIIYTL